MDSCNWISISLFTLYFLTSAVQTAFIQKIPEKRKSVWHCLATVLSDTCWRVWWRVQPFERGRKRLARDAVLTRNDPKSLMNPVHCVFCSLSAHSGGSSSSSSSSLDVSFTRSSSLFTWRGFLWTSPSLCSRQTGPLPLYSRYLECLSSNSR